MSTTGPSLVTTEAPWLGLRAFTEDLRPYFFGRDRELDDLFERVAQKPLTVLFGQSGLGKTSLIQAALLPRLHHAGFVRVLLRLDHGDAAPPLEQQLLRAVQAAVDSAVVSMPNDDLPAPLWRLLHDPAYGLCREGAPRVVLMLDQFEEIFTLGESNPTRRAASRTFLHALAEVVENRVPAVLRSILEEDEALADRIDFGARPLKLLISLREDFLHRLERWRAQMPSLMDNRLELRLLTGPQALQAVVEPGKLRCAARPELPPIVSEATGAAIVRFVADVEDDVPLAEIDAVPPLLSLLCAELNAQRGDSPTIRAEQIEGRAEDILHEFYERCFAPHPVAVRRFVEDRLLSPEGFRQNANQDTFLHEMEHAGITDAAARAILGKLVDDRLIISEERAGIHRIELTHDTLTGVARTSRDQRMEREEKERAERELLLAKRRNRVRRLVTAAMVMLTALAGAGLVWALRQRVELASALMTQRRTLADADYRIGQHLYTSKELAKAMQQMATALRWQPDHRNASINAAFMIAEQPLDQQLLPSLVNRLSEGEAGTLELAPSHRFAVSHGRNECVTRDPITWQVVSRELSNEDIEWVRLEKGHLGVFAGDHFRDIRVNDAGELGEKKVHLIGTAVQRVIWSAAGEPVVAVLRGGDEEGEHDLIRFFSANEDHPNVIRGTGKVAEVYVTPDGNRALVSVKMTGGGGDELRLYEPGKIKLYDKGGRSKPLWTRLCGDCGQARVSVRADGKILIWIDNRLIGLDAEAGKEWFPASVFSKYSEAWLSHDGKWAVLPTSNHVLVYFPSADEMRKPAVRARATGPGHSIVLTESFYPSGCVFLDGDQKLVVSLGGDKEGMRIYDLDAAEALDGLIYPAVELKSWYGKSKLIALGTETVGVWHDDGKFEAIVMRGDDVDNTWSFWKPPLTSKDDSTAMHIAPVSLGTEGGLVMHNGDQVTVWSDVYDDREHLQKLHEQGEVTEVWYHDGEWVTATRDHVARWPVKLERAPAEQILGANPDYIGAMHFDSSAKARRQLPDGRWLWRRPFGEWGLADAGRDWVTFATKPISDEDEPLNTQATCTADGNRLWVATPKGLIQEWNTLADEPPRTVAPPDASAQLVALHPLEPRALYATGQECLDIDLTGKRPPLHLDDLPGRFASFGSAIGLSNDQGWLVVCELNQHTDQIWRVGARLSAAVPVSKPIPRPEAGHALNARFTLSPSGRYWAAIGGHVGYGVRWFWCSDAGSTIFDDKLHDSIGNDVDKVHGDFDPSERFFGVAEDGSVTLDLLTKELQPVSGSMLLASRATKTSVPEWLPTFLEFLATGANDTMVSRQEYAERLRVAYPSSEVFAQLASTWIGPLPPKPRSERASLEAPITSDPLEAWNKFERITGKITYFRPDDGISIQDLQHFARDTLLEVIRLYRERLAVRPLDPFHAARYGEALLRTGNFADAAQVLTAAEQRFPFHVTKDTTEGVGKDLRKHLSFALWLGGQKDAAANYAQARHFRDTLWRTSPSGFVLFLEDRVETSDCDAELRQAQPSTPANPEPLPKAAPSQIDNSSEEDARNRAWRAIGSAANCADEEMRSQFWAEAIEALDQSANAARTAQDNRLNDLVFLALVQKASGRTDDSNATLAKAEAYFLQASKLYQARLRQAQGKTDEALALWFSVGTARDTDCGSTATATYAARQLGRLDYAREFMAGAKQYGAVGRFVGVVLGWVNWETGEESEALKAWQIAEDNASTKADSQDTPPHEYQRADWLLGMSAVLAEQEPDVAVTYWRSCLRARPDLGLPGALDGEFMQHLWLWKSHGLEPVRGLQRMDVMRARLKQLHSRLGEDERIAAHAAGLLALNRAEEAIQLLDQGALRFPLSPSIAFQHALAATRDHDDEQAVESWQVVLDGLPARDRESRNETGGHRLSDDGRPSFGEFLKLALRIKGGALGKQVASLLPLARARLNEPENALADGWLLLALLDQDTERAAEAAFMVPARAFQEKHAKSQYINDSDDALRKQLNAAITIDEVLNGRPSLPPMEAYAELYDQLGVPGENLANWGAQLEKWQVPLAVVDRLRPIYDKARKESLESARLSAPFDSKLRVWLDSLGHHVAAIEAALQDPKLEIEERAELLLEQDTKESRDEVIVLLKPVIGQGKHAKRRLLLARALAGNGRREEAFSFLKEITQSPEQRDQVNGDEAKATIELVIKLAVELGQPGIGQQILERAPTYWPSVHGIAMQAARSSLAQGKWARAIELFEQCSDKETKDQGLIGKALALWQQGLHEEALDSYVSFVWNGTSGRADADYVPPGMPPGWHSQIAVLRSEVMKRGSQEFTKRVARLVSLADAQFELWNADVQFRLGFYDEAIAAVRTSLRKVEVTDIERRARICYQLAIKMTERPDKGKTATAEAEALARESASLAPDQRDYWEKWLELLCETKQSKDIPIAMRHLLNFEPSDQTMLRWMRWVRETGVVELTDAIYEAATERGRRRMVGYWIVSKIEAGKFQSALDLLQQNRSEVDSLNLARITAFANAGMGEISVAMPAYLELLSLSQHETDAQFAATSSNEWRRLRDLLQSEVNKLPIKSLIDAGRTFLAIDRERLITFANRLIDLIHRTEVMSVYELVLNGATDNADGSEFSVYMALSCLKYLMPGDPARARHYMERPQWSLLAGAPKQRAFLLNQSARTNNSILCFEAMRLGDKELARLCIQLRQHALDATADVDSALNGVLLEMIGDHVGADAAHATDVVRFGSLPGVLQDRIWVLLFYRRQIEAAQTMFAQKEAILHLQGDFPDAQHYLVSAALHWLRNEHELAIEDYRRAANIDPDYRDPEAFANKKSCSGNYWPSRETEILEPLRKATLAKYPELAPKPATAKP